MVTRVFNYLVIQSDRVGVGNTILNAALGGDGCPTTLPPLNSQWTRAIPALSGPQQTAVAGVRSMLEAYVESDVACAAFRSSVVFWRLALLETEVSEVTAYVSLPGAIAGQTRQTWMPWAKNRTSFSSGERDDMDALAASLIASLEAAEPL
jgi:hypothetical protein